MPEQDKAFDFETERQAHLDIAAYYYKGGTVCSRCLRDRIIPTWPVQRSADVTTEHILDEYAKTLGLDREKPNFPSYTFPHRMPRSELMDSDRCWLGHHKL
ncbi:hypothetical protein VM98_03100 [Streptomyces rubellomurinus subsp. indigoferus]|nr:hypothetical protein VM98_03100 [Streptomyces rubellomurinus subsp. indigoferus]